MGYSNYPVFTQKQHTDINYLACAKILLENTQYIDCQFATHNAQTISSIITMCEHNTIDHKQIEFQCLHGMGNDLYTAVKEIFTNINLRIYAPVGAHQELLPYLVRRLLENGANSSFVNQIINKDIDPSELSKHPFKKLKEINTQHKDIPLPENILQPRLNSYGPDLTDKATIVSWEKRIQGNYSNNYSIKLDNIENSSEVKNPADIEHIIGNAPILKASDVEKSIDISYDYFTTWANKPVSERASILLQSADLLEQQAQYFYDLIIFEAGKTWQDAVDEVREAVDFLRYYAQQANEELTAKVMPGPTGEMNTLYKKPKGVIFCISPWNFPLAIFLGQVSAALVCGNTVVAKPAPQTTIIAYEMLKVLIKAGLDPKALQLIPTDVETASKVTMNKKISGVMLTGSTATAQKINHKIAQRDGEIISFIAETGGLNAMIVDSTALIEQAVMDTLISAFKSTGQRCSACRVVYVQDDIAESFTQMLIGAAKPLSVGEPANCQTDIGPLIDKNAVKRMNQHHEHIMIKGAKLLYQSDTPSDKKGFLYPARIYKISSILDIESEPFGPALHIVSFKINELNKVIDDINATGYGLTFGIHTRLNSRIEEIKSLINAGNIYVNRNIIGAAVGIQPFGGRGLSGTGPKAGGPSYLASLSYEVTCSNNVVAIGGNPELINLSEY